MANIELSFRCDIEREGADLEQRLAHIQTVDAFAISMGLETLRGPDASHDVDAVIVECPMAALPGFLAGLEMRGIDSKEFNYARVKREGLSGATVTMLRVAFGKPCELDLL